MAISLMLLSMLIFICYVKQGAKLQLFNTNSSKFYQLLHLFSKFRRNFAAEKALP